MRLRRLATSGLIFPQYGNHPILPEMLRWLWRDYPRPDDPQNDSNRKLFVPVESQPEKP